MPVPAADREQEAAAVLPPPCVEGRPCVRDHVPQQGPLEQVVLGIVRRAVERHRGKVLRRAADTVTSARAASCRLTPTRNDTAVHIVMTVLHAARHELGLAITHVDLEINAVLDPVHAPLDELPAASRR
ncbi:hypothetical protein [Streptomyces sp. NPDC058622]|uniref:hypothetical protein n=1 Tax=Streptomyces sp. NPDC058622 TaxID=3346562 RepID=UPI00364E62D1